MRKYLTVVVVLCAVSVGLLAAQTNKPGSAGSDSAVQADRELSAAFEKGNSTTVNKLLDAEFTWIDTDGIMLERPDALRANLKPLLPITSDVKTIEHKYANGKVVWIQNSTARGTAPSGGRPEFVDHYHEERPHQGLGNALIAPKTTHVDRTRPASLPGAARRRAQVLLPRGRIAASARSSHTSGCDC